MKDKYAYTHHGVNSLSLNVFSARSWKKQEQLELFPLVWIMEQHQLRKTIKSDRFKR